MSAQKFVVLHLSVPYTKTLERFGTSIKVITTAKRGEVLDALEPFDRERLLELGSIAPADQYDVREEYLPGTVVRHVTLKGAAPVGDADEDDDEFDIYAAGDDDLVEWIQTAKPKESVVLDLVDDDATLAARVLAAEDAATGGDPRKGLTSKLARIAGINEEA